MNQNNTPIFYVVTCYGKHNQVNWQSTYTLEGIQKEISLWAVEPNINISIRTHYKSSLPNPAMPSAVDINLTKLSVKYKVVLKTNPNNYGSRIITYPNLENLLYSVLNYLEVTRETKMNRYDVLENGEN